MRSEIKIFRDELFKTVDLKNDIHTLILKLSAKEKRKLLKSFLLCCLHQLFCEQFKKKIELSNFKMECYEMDSKIIQILIHDIIETEEYTLEGIAYYTHIPYDVIYAAAYGINNQFSITLWAKLVELYIQVKPDIILILVDKLLEIKNKTLFILSLLKEV